MGIFGFVLSIGQALTSACKVVIPEVIKVLNLKVTSLLLVKNYICPASIML